VLCAVHSETVGRRVCCVQCRVRLYGGMCVVCSAECDCRAACVLCVMQSETVGRRVCCVQCRV